QTFQDFELILIDDGSPDDSVEVIAQYTDLRVKLIRQENRGQGGARNRGIEASTGKWIAFLDPDDQWLPGLLEDYYRVISDHPGIDFCYSSYRRVYQDGRSVPGMDIEGIDTPILSEDCFRDGVFVRFTPWVGAMAVQRALLEETGLFPSGVRLGTDRYLIIRIVLKSRQTAFIPREETLYYRDLGVSSQYFKLKRLGLEKPCYPACLLSTEEWDAQGKIPTERRASLRRFIRQDLIPWHIRHMGFDRAYGMAWTMLRRHVSPLRHPICYARALLSFGFEWLRSFPALRAIARLVTGKGKRAAG
ncbi:MAG: glycosyltransferase, partial [Thermoguttaceae bacterium]|nr:glycosyltransferase [Thermoguttaceae bacterium]